MQEIAPKKEFGWKSNLPALTDIFNVVYAHYENLEIFTFPFKDKNFFHKFCVIFISRLFKPLFQALSLCWSGKGPNYTL